MAAVTSGDESSLLSIFLSLDDETIGHLGGASWPPNWREVLRTMHSLTDEQWDQVSEATGTPLDEVRTAGREFREMMASTMGDLRNVVDEMITASGADEIAPAIEAGLVKLSSATSGRNAFAPAIRAAVNRDNPTLAMRFGSR